MKQNLATMTAASLPTTLPPALRHSIEKLKAVLTRGRGGLSYLPSNMAPTGGERSWMTTWKADLESTLAPADARDIRIEVAKNFTVMASRASAGEDDIRGQQMLYVEALDDLPLFAVRQACLDFRKGVVGDGKWSPTPAEIRARADMILSRTRADIFDLGLVLTAKPVTVEPPMEEGAQRLTNVIRRAERDTRVFPPAKEVRDQRREPERQQAADACLHEMRYADRPLSVSPELRLSKPFAAKDVSL